MLHSWLRRRSMPRQATVRELKNQTTALIREAERGARVVVTRRGRPVATLKPFEPKDLAGVEVYPTTAFDAVRRRILRMYPALAKETPEQARRAFERTTSRTRRSLPFKSWREMDRFAKGVRPGPPRQ